jgi:protein arginine kinase activator
MKCEVCKKNSASVHLTDVSNNAKRELHLCEECAKGQGVTIKSYLNKEPSYPEFLQQIAQSQSEAPAGENDITCPRCGITYRAFRSTGKFGCPHDYIVFKKPLMSLLEKIHGKVEHVGKVPSRTTAQVARQQELRSLRADLEKAVRGEAYEQAAEIRDRIYDLEGRDG